MADAGAPLLAADGVRRRYVARDGPVHALAGVTCALWPGEIVGVLGRSGAGKSTLARLLLGLEPPDSGAVAFAGKRLESLSRSERRQMRQRVQVVFQDPNAALDPRQRVAGIVGEGLAVHRACPPAQRLDRVRELLERVGLPHDDEFLERLPRALSGGERQRVAIARALASQPAALVLDEPVSALDASVRGQVLNLLLAIHRERGMAMLLIAHDLHLVAQVCTRVIVMAAGVGVDEGPVARVLAAPACPETAELLAAARWLAGEEPGGGG